MFIQSNTTRIGYTDGGNLLLMLLLITLHIIMEHRDAIIDSNTCNVFNLRK